MMEKREKVSKTIVILFLIFFCFSGLQFISPMVLPSESITDLSGTVGILDNNKVFETIPFPLDVPYRIGDRLCHQKQERSFFLNGNQMSFCSRCTAIWVGITIGLLLMIFVSIDLDERFMLVIICSLIPIGIDGTGQLLGFWVSTNISRVISGMIVGIPIGAALGIIVDEMKVLLKSKTT